jgi:succinate dehydrogenase / fumarate reductase, cytochrome b subunit
LQSERPTTDGQRGGAQVAERRAAPRPASRTVGGRPLLRTDIGRKYVMAISGILLMLFVLGHMIGNLKLYLGQTAMNDYAEWLRTVGEPALPREVLLWAVRIVLLGAVLLHIWAAAALTLSNRRARPVGYQAPRHYKRATFASRTMRWTGIIVVLFVAFHLLDLTWGTTNPDYRAGDPYDNTIASFQRVPVAIFYVLANLALAYHLFHGAWSLFQSMGWPRRGRLADRRRQFAIAFAVLIAVGNVSFPLAVLAGVIS